MSRDGRIFAAIIISLASPTIVQAQAGTAPPAATLDASAPAGRAVLPPSEYDRIATLGGSELSPDGNWVAYHYRRGSGGGELRYRRVDSDGETSVPMGSAPEFSGNSRWLIYTILADSTPAWARTQGTPAGPAADRGAAASGAEAAARRNSVGIVELGAGRTTVLREVQSFAVSSDGEHVALRRYAPAGRQGRGSDLVVRDLARGTELTFGNVAEYAWSDDGDLLAMVVDVGGKTGNAVQLLAAATGTLTSLDAGDTPYTQLGWRARSRDLVAMRERVDSAFADTSYAVVAWRGVGRAGVRKSVYDFAADSTVPPTLRVAAYREPRWSDDGRTIFIGFAPREPRRAAASRTPPAPGAGPARVEVWHWKDSRQYHQQNRQSQADRQRTLLASWQLEDDRVVRLTDDYEERIQLADDGSLATVADDRPYFAEALSGRAFRDIYTVDVQSGERRLILTRSAFGATVSPGSRYLLYTENGQWWSYDRTTGRRSDLTSATGSVFVNMEDDHPAPERRPYGIAGWTAGDRTVILQDRYDLWQVNPDGTNPVRLTRGREDSTVYRIVRADGGARPPDGGTRRAADQTIDPRIPLWLSATGDYNRKSGYARLQIGRPAERVLWLDRGVSRLARARDADVFSYVVESYEQPPELHLARGGSAGDFAGARQLSHVNDFLKDHAWGRQELMSYVNSQGDTLQMMLTYPADYVPGRQYPMVVYYYEKLSQGYQQFVVPTERATYNTTVFSQNGYFVLRPDVRFRAREPGFSGLDCVTSAVRTVLAMGMVDPARVGNMGHSWGGYQSAFYAVHAPGFFAATIAGAPLTNLISMYGYTSYNTGLPETGHFETGQERMEVPLWKDPQAYIRNSTVFAVDSLRTPLLLEEGDADGNVNYWQSMELYNFGRRLGKNVVFLLYNDENHGVARPESQRDYHRRQLEWFGHYLKGEPAADWITDGESYQARQKLLRDAAPRSAPGERDTSARTPR